MSLVLTMTNLTRSVRAGTSRGSMRISWARSSVCENVSKSDTCREVVVDLTQVKIRLNGIMGTAITHRFRRFLPIRIKIGRLEAGSKKHDVSSIGLRLR